MAILKWDAEGEKLYEFGVDRGVLFRSSATGYEKGVAWNGLTAVNISPEGGDENKLYADNIVYGSLRASEDCNGSIEAYTYPDEWEACDGSASIGAGVNIGQQTRIPFAFSWRTKIGNDTLGDAYGYKIHIIYGATVSPSETGYETINDSPDAITFSWDFSTIPVPVDGFKNTAHVEIDSTKCDKDVLKKIEDALYGTTSEEVLV